MTLDEIVRRNALRSPGKRAVVADGHALSWQELNARIDQLANALRNCGLGPGERVAILLGNCREYIELYMACARAELLAVPLSYRLTAREARDILRQAAPSLLVHGATFAGTAHELADVLCGQQIVWSVGSPPGSPGVRLEDEMARASVQTRCSNAGDSSPCAIFYTSGTTGLPKGALVSALNLEANGYNQIIADAAREDDINLIATPLYHMGAVFMAITYMMLGCSQVILPHFSPRAWTDAVRREGATVSLLISTMINALLNDPSTAGADLSSLRLIFYGGGPMPPAVLRRALSSWRCAFTQGYGLTETLEATFLVAADHVLDGDERRERRLASAGREAVGAQVRIVNPEGRDLGCGEVGEVLVRSRSVSAGYWRQPEETARTLREGWFHTGDLGFLDEDRYLFIVDRLKDMVVTGGVNVYTKEVEAVLYTHPAVVEAAVIGLPDERWGEAVTAVVVLRPGLEVSEAQLIEHCRADLASFKKPRRVLFLSELPKNPSGKILKRELRRLLESAGPAKPGDA